ncbi:MAG: YkgJ family cysteine cluster protein [Cyanobacteriota bacterium]
MSICSRCNSGCCRRYSIGLTGYDMLNISKNLGVKPEFFTETYEIKDNLRFDNINKYNAVFKFTDNDCSFYYYFRMKKIKSCIVPDTWKCIFLQEWQMNNINNIKETLLARCSIYHCRPYICASYPAKLDEKGLCGIVEMSNDHANETYNPAYNLCSEPFTIADYGFSNELPMKNLALQKYELEFFRSIAENWNKNPFSIDNFFFVLESFYQNRLFFFDQNS